MARFKRQRDRQNELSMAMAALLSTSATSRAIPDEDRQRDVGLLELQSAVRVHVVIMRSGPPLMKH